jgi:hypothetical protein
VNCSTAADALHQSGQRADAGTLFGEAERMQKEMHMEFDLLYSVRGFWYCDWSLAPAERAAWQALLRGTGVAREANPHGQDGQPTTCAEVERRATITLKWAVEVRVSLLSIALDHLTLARVGLVRALLAHPLPQPALDLQDVAAAVNGLRDAGHLHYLPLGLLTAAMHCFVRGDTAAARTYLDQAQENAARGPMALHLADVHLHRARLFRDKAELAKAAQLIRELGYGRRYDELADAEAAATTWPTPPR